MTSDVNASVKPTLLYADDESLILNAVKRVFRAKYNLVSTTDCVEAYRLLISETPPNYAILDNIFEGQSFEGIGIIERLYSEMGGLPSRIILCSGTIDQSIRRRAEARGAKCIDKPFDIDKLLRMLSSFS